MTFLVLLHAAQAIPHRQDQLCRRVARGHVKQELLEDLDTFSQSSTGPWIPLIHLGQAHTGLYCWDLFKDGGGCEQSSPGTRTRFALCRLMQRGAVSLTAGE